MAEIRYKIQAYSPSQNQLQEQLDLQDDFRLDDPAYAQLTAQAFTERLNRQFFLHANDWQARIIPYTHIPNGQVQG